MFGFCVFWVCDVLVYDLLFGDVVQVFEMFLYFGYFVGIMYDILFGIVVVVLLLCELLLMLKLVVMIQELSGGCLLFGVVSGDWLVEYLLFGCDFVLCGVNFCDQIVLLCDGVCGYLLFGLEVLFVVCLLVLLFVVGFVQQMFVWIGEYMDGCFVYLGMLVDYL